MANENFLKLSERRKQRIINAIEACLREKDISLVTIDDILNKADISRASFYNYFSDLNDSFNTYLEKKFSEFLFWFLMEIPKNNFSLWDTISKTYYYTMDLLNNEDSLVIGNHIINYISNMGLFIYSKNINKYIDIAISWLTANTEEGKNELNSRTKMSSVIHILISVYITAIVRTIFTKANSLSIPSEIDFQFCYNIIKDGVKVQK